MNRLKQLLCQIVSLALLMGCPEGGPGGSAHTGQLDLSAGDRLLILAPHPDDEVLGCGGVIQNAKALGVPVDIVFLTYGDATLWSYAVSQHNLPMTSGQARRMGMLRHGEALAADASLGVPRGHVTFLGYPDRGTLAIWYSHWGGGEAYRSPMTQAQAVPYRDAYRPGAAYNGESLLADLVSRIREIRPTRILVSHPADLHPDHQALYLFTRIALWNLRDEIQPRLYPYLVHHPRWPSPSRPVPGLGLAPPPELAGEIGWIEVPLASAAVAGKLKALRHHRTQYISDGAFLRRFVRANELFGDFPNVTLEPGAAAVLVAPRDEKLPPTVPEELTRAEEELFVEIESITLRQSGRELEVTASFSRPLQREARLSLYVFGYRPDRPFGAMPKLHVQLGEHGQAVYDQVGTLPPDSVSLSRESRAFVVHIPLGVLGNPDRLLISGRSYTERVPLDWTPWRIVDLF